ncbi:hypothetical protein BJ322DRAFT_1076396 [Thelephora terrestris]|uniref:RRM domain-containing protein n=1 Tax=Thelephora terrestris TaxID=56493 RepID=A0A9P6HAD9_9AGAM|nr:hypothetical protein BJ322DRAFT_1076396 [Thelephora terrestris]
MTATTGPYSVKVTNISPSTTESQLHEYFTFCGKIASIDFDEKSSPKSALIHFEKAPAAKTALMLNGGTLNDAHLTVASEEVESDDEESRPPTPRASLDQTDKPRAAIAAEYLAKGYALSDQVLQRAIELDKKQGISKRFLSYFHSVDSTLGQKALGPDQTISGKVQASVSGGITQARTFDEQKGVTKKIGDYYTRALGTSVGQKVQDFYTTTTKHVRDIHEEASRIAGWHKTNAVETPADAESSTKDA